MQLVTKVGAFRNALNSARQVTPATPSMLAYSGVFISLLNNIVSITGSDGETTIVSRFTVESGIDGSVLVLPKPLSAYLSSLDSEVLVTVQLNKQGDEISVTPTNSNVYNFRTISSTFPLTVFPAGDARKVNFTRFASAISSARLAAAKENPVVQLVSSEIGLALHSTDNYRLTRVYMPEASIGDFTGVLSLQVLERLAKMEPTDVTVDSRSRVISFSNESTTIITRLLSTPFPNVDGVIEGMPKQRVTINSELIVIACDRLASLTDSAPVQCKLQGKNFEMTVRNADLGSGAEGFMISENEEVSSFEFLARLGYLKDAVVSTNSKIFILSYSSPIQPLYIWTESPMDVMTVVMPVRG